MINLKTFSSLIIARNKEFYRDKGSLTWAILFPLLVIVAISFAFQGEDQEVFKIGILGKTDNFANLKLVAEPWVTTVEYEQEEKALNKIRHHQLDLLLKAGDKPNTVEYWVNPKSSRSKAAEQILLREQNTLIKQEITGRAIRYVDWVIPGVLGMNIMFGSLFGIGYVIVRYRKTEVLKRIQATPVTALEYLSAQVISRLLVILIISACIFAGCNLLLNFMVLGSYWLLFFIALLGACAMISLGLVIASRTDSEELAGGLLNFATFPMMLLSEVWFSLDNAPDWMRSVSDLLPLTHLVGAARKVMLEGADLAEISTHLWVLGIMSLVLLALASRLFRWSKS